MQKKHPRMRLHLSEKPEHVSDNFEKTCAAQAMTLKVLMATDFFHGPPFQIKREFQEKKEIVRGL